MDLSKIKTNELIEYYKKIQVFLDYLEKEEKQVKKEQ